MGELNNLAPSVMPRATEHIPEMLAICEKLVANGVAYESGGSVYFDVRRPESFGSLFRAPYAEQLRVANQHGNFPDDPRKKDPLDFVLWQAKQPGEPSWSSPWGDGRPGWHIECSAMSMKYLGDTLTFHGGGQDLLFPHHDCEIAQSERYTGKTFVRYWVHTGLVALGPEKMSKSLGNMVFVDDLSQRFPGDAIRLLLIGNHYRQSWPYTDEAMTAAAARERALNAALAGAEAATPAEIEAHGGDFLAAMADDLDTPRALDALERLAASGDAAARRVGASLARTVLGLRL
jgi:L-cysteine:1D-myo-inositol 2-amino-2-deoxy-alpha-D-glucopyranoside ligase